MKAHEITEAMNGGMNSYVGFVRAVVTGAGSMNSRVRFEADSLASARYLLYRIYGRENVLGVQEVLIEDGAVIKPLSPEQLQVKSLTDKSAQLHPAPARLRHQKRIMWSWKRCGPATLSRNVVVRAVKSGTLV